MAVQWSLVLFTALAGAGAWLFAATLIGELKGGSDKLARWAALGGFSLLVVGGLCSVTHLSHPERILAALAHPAPGIFLEALLLGIDAVVAVVYALLVARQVQGGARRVLAVLALGLAVAFTFSTGASYTMAAQLAWNTIALPLAYTGTAAVSGAALYLVLAAAFHETPVVVRKAAMAVVASAAAALVLAAAYGVMGGVALSGEYAVVFWLIVIVCGAGAPLVCGVLTGKRPETGLQCGLVGAVGALIGAVGLRAIMWMVGSGLMALFGVSI